jgi:hypothetical protein
MGRTWGLVGALVVLTSTTAFPVRANPFEFHPPKGWVETKPRPASAEQLETLTSEVRAASARTIADTIYYAAPPGFDGSMFAHLRAEKDSEALDDAALDQAAQDLGYHDAFVVEQKRLEVIEQRAWGRFVGHAFNGSRFLIYLVPGKPRSLFVTFTLPPERFVQLEPELDAAARATKGAGDPPHRNHFPTETLLLGSIVGVALLAARATRRSKKKPGGEKTPRAKRA